MLKQGLIAFAIAAIFSTSAYAASPANTSIWVTLDEWLFGKRVKLLELSDSTGSTIAGSSSFNGTRGSSDGYQSTSLD